MTTDRKELSGHMLVVCVSVEIILVTADAAVLHDPLVNHMDTERLNMMVCVCVCACHCNKCQSVSQSRRCFSLMVKDVEADGTVAGLFPGVDDPDLFQESGIE